MPRATPEGIARELTKLDGIDRTTPDETQEVNETLSGDEKRVALNLEAIMALPEVEARIANVAAQAAAQAVAQAMGLQGPAKTMQSKVHDRFITTANGSGEVLEHWRCDNAIAKKIVEMDMDLYEKYESGELEVPRSEKGRKLSIVGLCSRPGQYITIIDTHAYLYTENQCKQFRWLQNRAPVLGGIPSLYQDFGQETDRWICEVCQQVPPKTFSDRRTWEEHRLRTHGIQPAAAA